MKTADSVYQTQFVQATEPEEAVKNPYARRFSEMNERKIKKYLSGALEDDTVALDGAG